MKNFINYLLIFLTKIINQLNKLKYYNSPLKEPIFLIAMSKSASSFLSDSLPKGLNINYLPNVTGGAEPNFLLNQSMIEIVYKKNLFADTHAICNDINKLIIKKYFKKIIVHVRDPRQACLSYLHNILRNQKNDKILNDLLFLPNDFFDKNFNDQLDFIIDNRMQFNVKWIQSWINFSNSENVSVHFSTYEELVNNEENFYNQILFFYNIDKKNFKRVIKKNKNKYLFRKGKTDEWKTVFNSNQIKKVNELMPDDFFSRFNWQK